MRPTLIALLLLAATITSCKNSKQALELNNTLSGYTTSLQKTGTKLNGALTGAATSKDFSEVDKYYKQAMSQISDYLQKVDETEDVGNSGKLLNAMKDLLNYDKKFMKEAVMPITKMDKNTTDEEINTAYQKLREDAEGETKYLTRLQKEQKAYAKANRFKIEATPAAKEE